MFTNRKSAKVFLVLNMLMMPSLYAQSGSTGEISANATADNSNCLGVAPGDPALVCNSGDVGIADATSITILDDGCKSPTDTVTFTANFRVESNTNRYDIGIHFSTDGDP